MFRRCSGNEGNINGADTTKTVWDHASLSGSTLVSSSLKNQTFCDVPDSFKSHKVCSNASIVLQATVASVELVASGFNSVGSTLVLLSLTHSLQSNFSPARDFDV